MKKVYLHLLEESFELATLTVLAGFFIFEILLFKRIYIYEPSLLIAGIETFIFLYCAIRSALRLKELVKKLGKD